MLARLRAMSYSDSKEEGFMGLDSFMDGLQALRPHRATRGEGELSHSWVSMQVESRTPAAGRTVRIEWR
jgi:hypothetical protein